MEAAANPGIGGFGGILPEVTRLNVLLEAVGMEPLSMELGERFSAYQRLLVKWNTRFNLTSIRSEEEILRRHFIESIFCARHLPMGISTLLDFGSGAGFPGIPIALCCPEIRVTLAEAQVKKAAFLREASRVLDLKTEVYSGRVENLSRRFSAVAMRAVERMEEALPAAMERISTGGTLVLLVGSSNRCAERYPQATWNDPISLPYSEKGVMLTARIVM